MGIAFMVALVLTAVMGLTSRRVVTTVVTFILTFLAVYLFLPTLSIGFWGMPFIVTVVAAAAWIIEDMITPSWSRDYNNPSYRMVAIGVVCVTGLIFLTVIPFFTTFSMFHHAEYRSLMGEIPESDFSEDTVALDPTRVRVVDQQLASRMGEKRLGEDPALGSIVNLGTPHIQRVRGELYWVIPLSHSGFFKWFNNRSGTPGYILVSATNERDVELVQSVNGNKISLRYNGGSYFGDNIHRYLYTNGYQSTGLMDFTFEINDEGEPYWVVTRFAKRVGYSGADPTGVIVLDAQTGEFNDYELDEIPEWIDRVQPADLVERQLNWWGKYVNGWWLQNMSWTDRLRTSSGITLVYGDDGASYWYTGMTSYGSDNSTVGFVLVNTRTKEARLYRQSGATEDAAKGSAEGAVQEKEYVSTFPILYNVGGLPTYFMTLKDRAGLVKLYAFVSVEDYQIVGTGTNVRDALNKYSRALASTGNMTVAGEVSEPANATGTVLRINRDAEGNVYLQLKGYEDRLFIAGVSLSLELTVTERGDTVQVGYDESGSGTEYLTDFDNLNLSFRTTAAEDAVVERESSVQ